MTKLTNEKIAKRLRIAARHDESQGRMMSEAADLIEQQQREIRELESVNTDAVKALAERNTLVAHVERLEDEITGIINDSVGLAGYHMNGDIASWQEFDIENILEQSPQTSLAEHDREVRARAVEDASCEAFDVYQREQCENGKSEFDHIRLQGAKSVVNWMAVWSNKIRNEGKDGNL